MQQERSAGAVLLTALGNEIPEWALPDFARADAA
jgi:hypothetical protein